MHTADQGGWVIANKKTRTPGYYMQLNKETDLSSLGWSSLCSEAVFRSETAKGRKLTFYPHTARGRLWHPSEPHPGMALLWTETLGSLTWPYIAKQYTFTQDFLGSLYRFYYFFLHLYFVLCYIILK